MCGCNNNRRTRARNSRCRRWQEERRGYVSMDIYNAQAGSNDCNCNCNCNCGGCGD